MKTIKEYLPAPKAQTKTFVVQGRVSQTLADDVRKVMKRYNLRWTDVLESCLKRFNEEMKK